MITRIMLFIVAACLIAAHFLRMGNFVATALCLAAPALFFVRRRWSLLLLQGLAYGAAAVWVETAWQIAEMRRAFGEPWLRAALILADRRRRQRAGRLPSARRALAGALSPPLKRRGRPPPVEDVPDGKHGVAPDHARAGPAHHLPDALAHDGLVAMHGAIGAGRLGLAEHATLQAPASVVVQLDAVVAERRRL